MSKLRHTRYLQYDNAASDRDWILPIKGIMHLGKTDDGVAISDDAVVNE